MASGSVTLVSCVAVISALGACSTASSTPSGSGNPTNTGSGGSGGGQTSTPGGGSTNQTNNQAGANSSSTGGGSSSTGGGSTVSTGGGSTVGGAGAGAVTCLNTDKSIIPINSDGWVDKSCNACGIQGGFYWYADANTGATLKCGNGVACAAMTPPYAAMAPGPGMCISGTSTGNKDDWGAGIGLSFNASGGMNSVKSVFDATKAACGNITGFDITLAGNTNGIPIRIGFKTAASDTAISPFIPVGDPGGQSLTLSGATQIVINKAVIPADWMSTDPSPASPASLYDLQIAVAPDSVAAGKAFQLCVTGVKPVIDGMESSGAGGGGNTGGSCNTTSAGTIGTNLDISQLGPNYGFQNNVNNLGSGSASVSGAYGSSCASLKVMTSGISSSNNAPASYPSIVDGWHYGKWTGNYSSANAKTISALTSATSNWAFTPPAGQKWDVAYDMWVSSNKGITAPDGNTLEVMVWLDYSTTMTTNPIGTNIGTYPAAGTSWEVWYGATGSWHTVTYRRSPGSGAVSNFDLAPFLKDAVTRGTGATSWNLLGIEAGFELFNATSGGSIDSYSLTIN